MYAEEKTSISRTAIWLEWSDRPKTEDLGNRNPALGSVTEIVVSEHEDYHEAQIKFREWRFDFCDLKLRFFEQETDISGEPKFFISTQGWIEALWVSRGILVKSYGKP